MKKTVYVPQYTNTTNSQGRPLHLSPTPYAPSIDINQQTHENNDLDKLNSSVFKTDLIPSKTSSISACTIILTVFGVLVLLLAITAIIVSILLNSNTTSSNCSVTDSTILTTTNNSGTTTVVTTISTVTVVTTTSSSSPTCSNFTVSVNWNYPGNDLANISPMSIDICCAWCLSLGSSCPGYVYTVSASRCWIKSSITGSGSSAANTISAIR